MRLQIQFKKPHFILFIIARIIEHLLFLIQGKCRIAGQLLLMDHLVIFIILCQQIRICN